LYWEELGLVFLRIFLLACMFSIFYRFKVIKVGVSNMRLGFSQSGTFFSLIKIFLINFLFGWSIFLGGAFFSLFLDGEFYFSFLSQKTIGLIIFWFSATFLFLVFFIKVYFLKKLTVFFFEILNINWYFGGFFSISLLGLYLYNLREVVWLELVGARGILKTAFIRGAQFLLFLKPYKISLVIFIIFFIFILWR